MIEAWSVIVCSLSHIKLLDITSAKLESSILLISLFSITKAIKGDIRRLERGERKGKGKQERRMKKKGWGEEGTYGERGKGKGEGRRHRRGTGRVRGKGKGRG